MGTFLGEAIETYGRLPWRDSGIDPAVYWADLCEWCTWEHWGMRHRRDTAPFRGARKRDVDHLTRLCQQRTGLDPAPRRRLRVVE
jgi:hypothetical protein